MSDYALTADAQHEAKLRRAAEFMASLEDIDLTEPAPTLLLIETTP